MDDDKNKGSGILGLGDTPVSNRDRDLDDRNADGDVTRDRIRDDEATRDRARVRDNEETAREGSAAQGTGILGLGGTAVPKSPLDPTASDDLDSAHRRRERMLDAEGTTGERGAERHAGAAGIDMGAGGEGTDVSGR